MWEKKVSREKKLQPFNKYWLVIGMNFQDCPMLSVLLK